MHEENVICTVTAYWESQGQYPGFVILTRMRLARLSLFGSKINYFWG